ncbi:MAG: four helix bundle protein [Planctomycetia bacterium]|nr:four helix bundle protein [Planctomycetia bacterium]
MGTRKGFKDLRIWQAGMVLARATYRCTTVFPDSEKYGLVSQLRRASVSIPANIAEGWARNTSGEFNQFLGVTLGSLAELETLIELSHDLLFLPDGAHSELISLVESLRPSVLSFKQWLKAS